MTPEKMVEHIKRHYALNGSGEWETAAKEMTDDFFITMPPQLPFAGVYRGKSGLRECIEAVLKAITVTGHKIVEITARGDYAVVIIEMNLAGAAGTPVLVAELFKYRGDQICEIRPYYFDTAPIIAAASRT